jgi:hypothetical protein
MERRSGDFLGHLELEAIYFARKEVKDTSEHERNMSMKKRIHPAQYFRLSTTYIIAVYRITRDEQKRSWRKGISAGN